MDERPQGLDGESTRLRILDKARELGASASGIASVADLSRVPSYAIYRDDPYYEDYPGAQWPDEHRSVLVWALPHPSSQPSLDWWSKKLPGHTPGNQVLVDQSEQLRLWMAEELGITAWSSPYHPKGAGFAFLKDAAALAGLGVIGKHNLLITPEFGTRVRLRAVFMDADLPVTGPISDFDPCDGCPRPCHRACPQGAFEDGGFERARCKVEMDRNEAAAEVVEGAVMGIDEAAEATKYCRNCEFACPVAVRTRRDVASGGPPSK
jgi:epoxyqueuosine reductase